jgi:signal transduction histidine kinase
LVGAGLALAAIGLPVPTYPGLATIAVIATPLLLLGGLICARKPQVRLGPLLLGLGLAGSVELVSGEYATYSALGRSGRLFATGAAGWLSSVAQIFLVIGLVAIILLFPTGRLLSRRWRAVAWALGAGFIGTVVGTAFGGPMFNSNLDFMRNPLYVAHPPAILVGLIGILTVALVLGTIGSIAHLVVRLHRSRGDERQQLKWFAYAGIMAPLVVITLSGPLDGVAPFLGNVVWTLGPLSLVAALGIAVLRYRLYDIDVVIRKTVVLGTIAVFITVVYMALVVGPILLVGSGGGSGEGVVLSAIAAAVVAVAFQPVRQRARRFADRLVYGTRATPYEVLSEFSSRVGEAYASDDVLQRMAQVLAAGTGAATAAVWLRVGKELRPAAVWPEEASIPTEVPGDAVDVVHQGDLLGALSVVMPPSDPMNPAKRRLVEDLASQAGLALRNVRLIEELRASRQRLVAAQDQERRKLERNLHDGAQQQLVALAVKIRLAETLAKREGAENTAATLEQLQSDAGNALEDLRDLARGIFPPLLADKGLPDAIASQARKSTVPIDIDADGVGRYAQEVEAAVYFCSLEALQNVAKYAHASRASIKLTLINGTLTFEVTDDGDGFDPTSIGYGTGLQGMADRLDALGGTLEVRSAPGEGTAVIGRVPSV